MKALIETFIQTKEQLNKNFNCKEDYFIKPLINTKWRIKNNDGVFFLTYIDENNNPKECVIAKKNNSPMIYKKGDYTMVIGIECIKLAFILTNINNI